MHILCRIVFGCSHIWLHTLHTTRTPRFTHSLVYLLVWLLVRTSKRRRWGVEGWITNMRIHSDTKNPPISYKPKQKYQRVTFTFRAELSFIVQTRHISHTLRYKCKIVSCVDIQLFCRARESAAFVRSLGLDGRTNVQFVGVQIGKLHGLFRCLWWFYTQYKLKYAVD